MTASAVVMTTFNACLAGVDLLFDRESAGITALSVALALSVRTHCQFFPVTGFVSLPLTFASTALAPSVTATASLWLPGKRDWPYALRPGCTGVR